MFPTTLKHFTQNENWGNPDLMSLPLLYSLDHLRSTLNQSIVVTCGTQGMHEANSNHYTGHAVDIVLPDNKLSFFDLFSEIIRYPFTGIGYYPNWKYGDKVVGGWHLEQIADVIPRKKLWLGVAYGTERKYIALNNENLKKHGIT
jgi:hypothetical protein